MLKKNTFLKLTIILLLILISGCGTTGKVTNATASVDTKAESTEKGYVYQSDNEVFFINWTKDKDNKIVGQLQITELTNSGVQSTNHSFDGVIDDPKISITITGSILNDGLTGKVFTGSLDGSNKLTLLFPSSNGMMTPVSFTSGTVADFNKRVTALNQNYAKLQSDKQAQAQSNEQLKNHQDIITSLSSIDKKIKQDTAVLGDISFSDVLGQYDSNFKQIQQHYSKLKSDSNVQPFTSYQLSVVQYDLSTMNYDLSTLGYCDSVMQSKNGDIQIAIKNIQSDISTYKSLWSSNQGFGGQGSPISSDDMTTAISNAQAQISKAGDTQKSAWTQADSYNKQAKDLYSTAESFVKGLNPAN